jgi:hypothetical protein
LSDFDVHPDDMDSERPLPQLSDREVECILDGQVPAHRHDVEALAGLFEDLRATRAAASPRPDADLAAVFAHGLPEDHPPAPSWAAPSWAARSDPEPRRRAGRERGRWRPLGALVRSGTLLGTVAGKLMVAAAIAAASVGGAQVTGVVDVPGLPDRMRDLDDRGERRHDAATQASEAHRHHHTPASRAGEADDRGSDGMPASSEQPGDGMDGGETADRASGGAGQDDGQKAADEPGNAVPADDAPVADASGAPPADDDAEEAPAEDAADRAGSAADRRNHKGEGKAGGQAATEAGEGADDEATKTQMQTPKGAAGREDEDT